MVHYLSEKAHGALLSLIVLLMVLPIEVHAAGYRVQLAAQWQKESMPETVWLASSKASDQIKVKIVVTKRRRRGSLMDVDYRIEFTNVPSNKFYYLCQWDSDRKSEGEKPQCFKDAPFPMIAGGMFELTVRGKGLAQGQWQQYTIRSMDGTIEKSVRFTPFE